MIGDTVWSLYIILCSDGSFYTGISTEVERRFHQHQTANGAKYFRGRQPLRVVYQETGYSRAEASRREAAIKRLSRRQKLELINRGYAEAMADIPTALRN